jgi:hypothetical protein
LIDHGSATPTKIISLSFRGDSYYSDAFGYLPLWERLPAAINDGSTVLLRYSRLEAAPTG